MADFCAVLCFEQEGHAARLNRTVLRGLATHGKPKQSTWQRGPVALGILEEPLSRPGDHIPVILSDGSAYLAGHARLDNRDELLSALGAQAARDFSDLRLILAAWERWDEKCVEFLLGAFAFALWSPARRVLFAARDHTGECPLFYRQGAGFFALASAQRGLLAPPGAPPAWNEAKVCEFFSLTRDVPGDTYFEGIERLGVGRSLSVSRGRTVRTRYWDPLASSPTRMASDAGYEAALVHVLDQATAARLPAQGMVASHLTAGLDSSSTTASAALQLGHAGRKLLAFTAVPRSAFAGTAFETLSDEGPAAAEVARLYGNVEHHLVDSQGRDAMHEVRRLTDATAEPVRNVVNLTWMMAILDQSKALGADVLLTGQEGNATISYEGLLALRGLVREGRWGKAARMARDLRSHGEVSIHEALAIGLDGLLPGWLERALRPSFRAGAEHGVAILNPDLVAKHRLRERQHAIERAGSGSIEDERQAFAATVDLGATYAAFRNLTGVEVRDPTADKRVYEFCYSIPPEQFIVGGRSRSLVRRAMRHRLPASTVARQVRGYQGADWHLTLSDAIPAFRAELEEMESSPDACALLNVPYLRRLVETWPQSPCETREGVQRWNSDLTKGMAMGYLLRTAGRGTAPVPQDDQVCDQVYDQACAERMCR